MTRRSGSQHRFANRHNSTQGLFLSRPFRLATRSFARQRNTTQGSSITTNDMSDEIKAQDAAPLFGVWQPFAMAPKDRPILVAWGTVASGAMRLGGATSTTGQHQPHAQNAKRVADLAEQCIKQTEFTQPPTNARIMSEVLECRQEPMARLLSLQRCRQTF